MLSYSKQGNLQKALETFQQMQQHEVKPNERTWYLVAHFVLTFERNILLSAFAQQGEAEKAFELFRNMEKQGMKPDVVTWYCNLGIGSPL